jgi:hypothetical protein
MSLQQENTTACMMRDILKEQWLLKNITLVQITDRLIKKDLPDWMQAEIIQMCNFNKFKRTTCPVEQAMEAAVCVKIIEEIYK